MNRIVLFAMAFLAVAFSEVEAQHIALDDLIYIQTIKNSQKIDSLLRTKKDWDCACHRESDPIELNEIWVYKKQHHIHKYHDGLEQIEKHSPTQGQDISSITEYHAADSMQFQKILKEIRARKYVEKKISHIKNDTIDYRLSFYLTPNHAIETLTGKYHNKRKVDQFSFYVIDRNDYVKGAIVR